MCKLTPENPDTPNLRTLLLGEKRIIDMRLLAEKLLVQDETYGNIDSARTAAWKALTEGKPRKGKIVITIRRHVLEQCKSICSGKPDATLRAKEIADGFKSELIKPGSWEEFKQLKQAGLAEEPEIDYPKKPDEPQGPQEPPPLSLPGDTLNHLFFRIISKPLYVTAFCCISLLCLSLTWAYFASTHQVDAPSVRRGRSEKPKILLSLLPQTDEETRKVNTSIRQAIQAQFPDSDSFMFSEAPVTSGRGEDIAASVFKAGCTGALWLAPKYPGKAHIITIHSFGGLHGESSSLLDPVLLKPFEITTSEIYIGETVSRLLIISLARDYICLDDLKGGLEFIRWSRLKASKLKMTPLLTYFEALMHAGTAEFAEALSLLETSRGVPGPLADASDQLRAELNFLSGNYERSYRALDDLYRRSSTKAIPLPGSCLSAGANVRTTKFALTKEFVALVRAGNRCLTIIKQSDISLATSEALDAGKARIDDFPALRHAIQQALDHDKQIGVVQVDIRAPNISETTTLRNVDPSAFD